MLPLEFYRFEMSDDFICQQIDTIYLSTNLKYQKNSISSSLKSKELQMELLSDEQ